MNTISVVVLTKNNIGTINQCLDSVMPYYLTEYVSEIVIVDGHSTDGTIEAVKHYPISLFFDAGTGIANARNIGWRKAKGEIILFLDSDAYLGDNFFPKFLRFFELKAMGGVGCCVKTVVKTPIMQIVGEWQSHHYDNIKKIITRNKFDFYLSIMGFFQTLDSLGLNISITGPVYAVRRECLQSVNGFSEEHSMAGEELCLSRKILKKGWKTTWWLDSNVYHHPKETLNGLINEHIAWGKGDCIYIMDQLEPAFKKGIRLLVSILTRVFSPIIGIKFAIKFKKPQHVVLFAIVQYSWIVGCLLKIRHKLQ